MIDQHLCTGTSLQENLHNVGKAFLGRVVKRALNFKSQSRATTCDICLPHPL